MKNLIIQKNDKILMKFEDKEIYFKINSARFSRICLLCHNKINKGDLYALNRYKHCCLKCCQKYMIRNEGEQKKQPRKIIKCKSCHQKAEHCAHGLCLKCYTKYYKKNYPERVKAARIKWYQKNPTYKKNYDQNNKEKHRQYQAMRKERAKLLGNSEYLENLRKHYKKMNDSRRYDGNKPIVLLRDNNQCQICGAKEKLVIHHIDGNNFRDSSRRKIDNSLENLITLCSRCHRALHGYIYIQKYIKTKELKIEKLIPKIKVTKLDTAKNSFQPNPFILS